MHPSDVAVPLDTNSSAGTCQRFTSHLQLHLSAVTVLLAAAWAIFLHASRTVLACIASGVSNQTAAAKSHLLLLKRASPRFYKVAAAAKVLAEASAPQHAPAEQQLSCRTDSACAGMPADATASAGSLTRRRVSPKERETAAGLQDRCQHSSQHHASTSPLSASTVAYRPGNRAAAASGFVAHIPMQLEEHRGRLTIALDLDETLLCTYRLEHCKGPRGDALQLVPANRPGAASTGAPSRSSSAGLSWSSLLRRSSSGGSGGGRSRSDSDGGSSSGARGMGSYNISMQWTGPPGELGAAASASAWLHYTPPPPLSRTSSSSSSRSSDSGGASDNLSVPQQQQQQQAQQLAGPHSLAVFLRPGCREFLCQLACFAEVVLFTAASPEYGTPLAELLDPSGQVFRGRLYADACTSRAGRRGVKDLEVLGRDVRRVVLVDNCLFSFLAQPRNGLPCLPYHGAHGDTQLLSVILPLLRSLSQVGGDIRPLLDNMFRVRQWLESKGYNTADDD